MTPNDLIEALEVLADAPEGVERLRELILQLAVIGKLVAQDPADEPASTLLERIAEERRRSSRTRDPQVESPEPTGGNEGSWGELPPGWEWTCTSAIGVISPRCAAGDGDEAAFAPMPVIPTEFRDRIQPQHRKWGEIKKGYTHFANGDVVVAKITPCFQNRKSCVIEGLDGVGAGTTELHVVRPLAGLEPRYLLIFYKTPAFIVGGVARMTGTAGQQRVPRDYFASTPLPLPPLAEQKRIISRVDELMALLDQLEAARTTREATRAAARDSTLAALRGADAPEEVEAAWNRFAERMDDLVIDPADIAPVRQTVLELAVRGRLVPQDPNDEPASALLRRIAAQKALMVTSGQIRKPRPVLPLRSDELPFSTPLGWAWCRLQDVHQKLGAGSTPLGGRQVYVKHGIAFLRSQNVWNNGLRLDDVARIPATIHERMAETAVRPNDVLLNITGASIGRSAIVPAEFEAANVSQHVAILRQVEPAMNSWVHLFAISPHGYACIMGVQVGISREGLSMGRLSEFALPVPPLAEQGRIVGRVRKLMSLLDRLETLLGNARKTRAAFAAAAVHHLDA